MQAMSSEIVVGSEVRVLDGYFSKEDVDRTWMNGAKAYVEQIVQHDRLPLRLRFPNDPSVNEDTRCFPFEAVTLVYRAFCAECEKGFEGVDYLCDACRHGS
jgi:hypothetical protein